MQLPGRALQRLWRARRVWARERYASQSRASKNHPLFPGESGRRQPHVVTPFCLALSLSLSACTRPYRPADLVIVNGNEPESLDPAIVTGVSEMRITKALFEG